MANFVQKYWAVFFGIILGRMVALQLATVDKWSFWFDESFTSFLIKYDYVEVAVRTARDVHPPLYYWLLKLWSSIVGDGDFELRLLSVVLITSAVIAGFFLVRKLTKDTSLALLSMLAASTGAFVVRYAQEARMYALAALLVVFATCWLVKITDKKSSERSTKDYVIYSILVAACLYTHYFTFPVILAHIWYVLLIDTKFKFTLKDTKKSLKSFRENADLRWIRTYLGVGVLFAPWLPVFIMQSTRVSSGFWIPDVELKTIPSSFVELLTFQPINHDRMIPQSIAQLLVVALAGLLVYLFIKASRKEKGVLVLLLGPVLISAVILFAYSIIPGVASIYYIRYFASLSVLFYLGLIYATFLSYKYISKYLFVVLIAGLTWLMIVGVTNVINGEGKNFFRAKQGIEQLNSELSEGDLVVAQAYWQAYDTAHYIKDGFVPRVKIEGNFYGGDTLLINREDIVFYDYNSLSSETGVAWFISDSGNDYGSLPDDWTFIEEIYHEHDFKVSKFELNP